MMYHHTCSGTDVTFYISKLTTGIRVRELLVLQALLEGKQDVITYVSNELLNTYNVRIICAWAN